MKFRPLPVLLTVLCLAHTAGAQSTATWTNAAGGSWNTAANWGGTLPTWSADLTVDFSTLNITANRDLQLTTSGKIVGRIIFGDTTPSHQWDIVSGAGPLTLSTTSGQPEIDVVNWSSVITVGLGGTQGFEKTGAGTLRLNNTSNPITGEILASEGVLQIRDGTTNTPTAFADGTMDQRSLRVTGSGILDLWRVNATGTQNVTWTLPSTTLEGGGIIRFRTNNAATYNHTMGAALIAGTNGGTILNNGGTGVQTITLNGTISGSGPLSYTARDGGSNTRRLSISAADNPYSGGWSVAHEGTGTALLRADAANALGTGTVTVNVRATLENYAVSGLDSLAGVTLQESTSKLALGANPWTNASATLTAANGTIELGTGASTVGTFTLDSADTVTLDADAGGSLAAASFDIRQGTLDGTGALAGTGSLTKSTGGTATLAGTHTYTGATTVAAGTLVIGGSIAASPVTVDYDAAIGGNGTIADSLHFNSGSRLDVSFGILSVGGAVSFDGFGFGNLVGFDVYTADEGEYTLLNGSNFDFANISHFGAGDPLDLGNNRKAYFDSGSLKVVVIPEPGAAWLGGLGLLALLRRRRH